jgi:prevent-host-death family protein
MTLRVNIGEAKTRLSQLVAAAVGGEEVVLQKSGRPQVKLVPVDGADRAAREAVAKRRMAAFGKFKDAFAGADLSLQALKADRPDPDERERRALGFDL